MTTTDETMDSWHVQLDSGQIVQLDLDALQEAYDAGQIHDQTFVLQTGEQAWQSLGSLLGTGDEPAPDPAAPQGVAMGYAGTHAPVVQQPYALYAPVVPPVASVNAVGQLGRPSGAAPTIMSRHAPAALTAQSAPARPLGYNPLEAPPISREAVMQAAGTQASRPQLAFGAGDAAGPALSVVSSRDSDSEAQQFKSGRGRLFVAAGAFALAVGGVGFAVSRPEPVPLPTISAPLLPAPSRLALDSAEDAPTNPTSADDGEGSSRGQSPKSARFSDDVKRALLDRDKKRSVPVKRALKQGSKVQTNDDTPQGGTFRQGGDAFDPLNETL